MDGDRRAGAGEHPGTIRTSRLALTPMCSQLAFAIVQQDWVTAGHLIGAAFPPEWREDGWHWLESQATHSEKDHRFASWGTRLALPVGEVVGADRGPVLAEVGFHGPPGHDGWVEIGYRVVAAHRRQGLAEEATSALLAWAAMHGATGIRAAVSPDNTASIGLLHKLDFAAAGTYRHQQLGEQLIFRRPARPRA